MIAIPSLMLGRRAALTVLAALLVLAVFLVVVPLTAMFSEQNDEIDSGLQQLALDRAEIALLPDATAEIKAIKAQEKSLPGLTTSETLAKGEAKIQSDVRSLVAANGGQLRSAEILPVTAKAQFEVMAVKSELSVPMSHLHDLLYAIETHEPYLLIDNVNIKGPQGAQAGGAPDPLLDIQWTVRAYRRAGAP